MNPCAQRCLSCFLMPGQGIVQHGSLCGVGLPCYDGADLEEL
jgi:hypothetical protein